MKRMKKNICFSIIISVIGVLIFYNMYVVTVFAGRYIYLLYSYGLESIEVAKLRKNDHGKFTDNKALQTYVYDTAKNQNFELAVVSDEWVRMPDYFIKEGENYKLEL